MPNFVQEFRSTDVGMPVLNGVAGALIGVLDACLVNGGAAQPVTGIVEAGTTYTATIPADVTLENKDWLVIAGAAPAGANGTFQTTLIDSTHFSYVGPGSLGAITGSITYKRAPLGWTKPFVVGSVAAYLAAVVAGLPRFYLRVDDNYAGLGTVLNAAVRGYETMSDVNTGTGPFPTVGQQANGLSWRKSLTADATARPWILIGDGATFYLIVNSDNSITAGRLLCSFGAYTSFKPTDAYNCALGGTSTFNTGAPTLNLVGLGGAVFASSYVGSTGLYCARGLSQAGGAVALQQINKWAAAGGALGGVTQAGYVLYPAPADGALWIDTTLLQDATGSPRGKPRGLYTTPHLVSPFASEFDIATNVAGLPGVTLINYLHSINQAGAVQFDRYGPW
jgi:hypothetical protein